MIRLNRYLALCGISSRRAADDLIDQGRIKVNGRVIKKKGVLIDPQKDMVYVDDNRIEEEEKVYIIMNKPRGFITTSSDPQGRQTVLDLVPHQGARIYPVGRLDYNSQGLLLLTNDGDLSFRLLHPGYKVQKVYRVKLYGAFSPVKIKKLAQGVQLSDGLTAPCEVRLVRSKGKETILEIKIYEGRKRQIRRMCNAVGYKVVELVRVKIGDIKLGALNPGSYRELGKNEVKKLKKMVGLY